MIVYQAKIAGMHKRSCRHWVGAQRAYGRSPRLMQDGVKRLALGGNFTRHQAVGAGSEAHQHKLTGLQFRHAEPTQGFHVYENVCRSNTAREKSKSAKPIEPFDLRAFETARWYHTDMGPGRHL